MRNRDFGFAALGRFLVVERYRETCLPPSTSQPPRPRPARAGGHADEPSSNGGSRVPARPRRG
jgi:hypothetical protein